MSISKSVRHSPRMVVATAGIIFISSSVYSPVFAVSDVRQQIEDQQQEMQQKRAEVNSLRTTITADRCNLANQRIATITSRYETNRMEHIRNYQEMVRHFGDVVATLEAKGYDVTKLRTDATTLDEKIRAFGVAYDAWVTQLGVAKQYACGESEGKFKDELLKSRQLALKVRQAAIDIRTFYLNTIKPDIKAVRAQKPKVSPTASPSASPVSQ